MITKTYVARPGSYLSDDDAERAGAFLEAKFGDNPITPADVVKAAKPKSSPIHQDFEWDDASAAQAHRLQQARMLLNSIEVILVNGEEKPPTKAFHNVVVQIGDDRSQAYVPARVVWEQPDLSQQVVSRAFRELASWKERYKEYRKLASAVEAVTEALERIAA